MIRRITQLYLTRFLWSWWDIKDRRGWSVRVVLDKSMKMWHKRQFFSLAERGEGVWVETVVACHAGLGYIVTGAPLATQNFRFRMCLNFSKTSGGGRAARPGDVLPLPPSIQLTTGDSQNKFPPRSFEACNYVFRSATRRGLVRDIIRFRASFTWHYDKLKGSSEMELTVYKSGSIQYQLHWRVT